MLWAYALAGAVSNRLVRGSGVFKPNGDLWNSAVFAALISLLPIPDSMAVSVLSTVLSGVTLKAAFAAMSFACMWAVMAPGWGEILGAIGGALRNWFEGVYDAPGVVSWLCRPLEGRVRLWGWCAGVLRGLIIGVPFAILFGPWCLLAGAAFPACYFLGASVEQIVLRRHSGFEGGEVIFGAVLWAVAAGSCTGVF